MEAAGIAPASQIPQVVSLHDCCVEHGCQWLHYVCTDTALRELVANWQRLTPDVKPSIMQLVRGGGYTKDRQQRHDSLPEEVRGTGGGGLGAGTWDPGPAPKRVAAATSELV
jgi:hypothetical protein